MIVDWDVHSRNYRIGFDAGVTRGRWVGFAAGVIVTSLVVWSWR
jgi:tetrahydromethanopterin S-methyltransferase subunit F